MAGPREPIPEPIISFDAKHTFYSFYFQTDFMGWAKSELDSFDWIQNISDPQLKDLISTYGDFLNLLLELQGTDKNLDNVKRDAGNFRFYESRISSFFDSGRGISSHSPQGQFINKQRTLHGDVSAIWSLNSLVDKPINSIPQTFEGLQGVARAATFENNSFIDADSLQSKLSNSIEQSNQLFKNMESKFDSIVNKNNLAVSESKSKLENSAIELIAAKSQRDTDFESFLSESRSQVQETKDLFSVALALEAPVTYWTAKAKRHLTMMGFSGASTFLIAGGLLWFIYMKSPDVTGSFADLNIGSVIFLLSVSTFLIWLIRLSAKIFIANLHLRDDAEERVTMMQAFLALSRDTESMSASDSSVIFNALFRPASSGLVKDDGVNSPIEVILNSFKSR